jgi:hypothetical protein
VKKKKLDPRPAEPRKQDPVHHVVLQVVDEVRQLRAQDLDGVPIRAAT